MTFDESNGSQVEQVDSNVIGNKEPPYEAIEQLAIGDVRSVEAPIQQEVPQLQDSTPLQESTQGSSLWIHIV